ncbi:RibD family protein [Luteolibacter soli]|uniref:RibD family protein n=1 Tax=Luteolibacter soli TaxID=3135280 RepID=A0ABU9B010_9BACT
MSRLTVSINFALSADGKISSAQKRPSGWTSREDHARLLELRKGADALMVGRGTLESDRMTMKAPHDPLRCVVSRSGEFDPEHPLFHTPGGAIHLLATEDRGRKGREIPGAILHRGSVEHFLDELAGLGVRRVHCEGGGELVFVLLERDLVDEIHLTWAGHRLFGGHGAPTVSGVPGEFLPASRQFELTEFDPRPETGECFLSYRRVREAGAQ